MPDAVTVSHRDDVAVVTLHNPPVNGLGFAVRNELHTALATTAQDPAVAAVVLTGNGKMFSGGADIREFNLTPPSGTPPLPTLIDAIETSEKPVVAAIHGVALGGGLELTLGCHARLAAPGTRRGCRPAGGLARDYRPVSVAETRPRGEPLVAAASTSRVAG